MKGGLPVNGTFFSVSVLIIAGCTCTIDVHGTNTDLLVSNTNTKETFPYDTEPTFYCFR